LNASALVNGAGALPSGTSSAEARGAHESARETREARSDAPEARRRRDASPTLEAETETTTLVDMIEDMSSDGRRVTRGGQVKRARPPTYPAGPLAAPAPSSPRRSTGCTCRCPVGTSRDRARWPRLSTSSEGPSICTPGSHTPSACTLPRRCLRPRVVSCGLSGTRTTRASMSREVASAAIARGLSPDYWHIDCQCD